MILIPNFGNRVPADGTSNAVVSRAVSISTVILNPAFQGDVDDRTAPFEMRHHRISSPVNLCPVAALNAALCDEWQLDVSVSLGAATVTATAQSLTITSTIGKRAGQDWLDIASYTDSATSGGNSISVEVEVGSLSELIFGRTLKQWSLPIQINVSGTNCQYSIGRQFSSGTYGASYSGIAVTVAGQTVLLYDSFSGGSSGSPTGSITLTPLSWLPLS